MNRTEFMRELDSLLQGIPEADRESGVENTALIGTGLVCGGVGLLFLMLTVAMAGIATPAVCQWIGGLFQKRGKANA